MARWVYGVTLVVVAGLAGVLVLPSLHGQNAQPAIPKELTSYRGIVKKVLPAVVSIETRAKQVARVSQPQNRRRSNPSERQFQDPNELFRRFFGDDNPFGGQFDSPDQGRQMPRDSFGSGFIIDPKGLVVTNYHVVAGADRVKVQLMDGRSFWSKDIKGDRKNDLAIVRIQTNEPLPSLEFGDSDSMEIGDRVLAVGSPFRLTGTVTSGIVSAKGRTGLNDERAVYEDYLQTDAAINPGNSGGPLVNLEGQVIGINTAIKTSTGTFAGIGLAITSHVAKDITDQLIKNGVVHRGYLGLRVMPLEHDAAAELGVKEGHGVAVAEVMPRTPAAKAGLKEGDIITEVAGKKVTDGRELQLVVGHLPINKSTDVQIVRDGKPMTLSVTIQEQPESLGEEEEQAQNAQKQPKTNSSEQLSIDKIGVHVSDVTPELIDRFRLKESAKGAIVTDVEQGSLGMDAGLRAGTMIMKINRKPVNSAEQVQRTLEKADLAKGVVLEVRFPPARGAANGAVAYLTLKAETAEK
jgi:serine protease Do